MEDRDKKAILRRRATFLASSLAAVGCGAGDAPTPVVPPDPAPSIATTSSAQPQPSAAATAAPSASASVPIVRPPVAVVCLSIVITPTVRFSQGSAVPTIESHETVDAAVEILQSYPEIQLMLEGHSDTQEPAIGPSLSLRRAEAVRKMLIAKGIDPARLCTHGFEDAKPLTAGTTAAQRARNQRVEFRKLDDGEKCP